MVSYIILRDVSNGFDEWGVSRNGSNPEPNDYIACATRDDAERLLAWLEGRA